MRIKSILYGADKHSHVFFTTESDVTEGCKVDKIEEFPSHSCGYTTDEFGYNKSHSYQTVYRVYNSGNLFATIINPVNCTITYWQPEEEGTLV